MDDVAERYRRLAAGFTRRVEQVPDPAWDNPAPCEGWLARDVVRHLVEWVPAFLSGHAGLVLPPGPPVDEDPAGAWRALDSGLQAVLDDPALAGREHDLPMGRMPLGAAVDMIVSGDLLIHTWDLARATGLDEELDAAEVHRMYAGIEPMDGALRESGHYGPRVPVADDASEQERLLAFTGRRP